MRFNITQKIVDSSHMLRTPTVKVPIFLGRHSKRSVSYQGFSLLLPLLSVWCFDVFRLNIGSLIRVSMELITEGFYVSKPSTMMTSPSLKLLLHVSLILMLIP